MAKKLVALGLNMPNRKSMDQSFFEPQPPKLKAIIFAEFDNEIGRVIKYQVIFYILNLKILILSFKKIFF